MKNFLKQNKIFLAIVIGSLIVGGVILIASHQRRYKKLTAAEEPKTFRESKR